MHFGKYLNIKDYIFSNANVPRYFAQIYINKEIIHSFRDKTRKEENDTFKSNDAMSSERVCLSFENLNGPSGHQNLAIISTTTVLTVTHTEESKL